MDIYFAGEYQFAGKLDLYHIGYDRLVSYGYQKKYIDQLNEGGMDMDLYLAGGQSEKEETFLTAKENHHLLFNYIDGKRATDRCADTKNKLFVDSGAFSAWTKGKQVDADEYIAWLNERPFIDLFGQIDVIPGDIIKGATTEQVREAAQLTWDNYLYMRERVNNKDGLLYTFHVGEPYEYLQQALEWKDENGRLIPYIALGGMVGKSMPLKREFLESCFNIISKSSNPNVKVHAFGMTTPELLEKYPITSADSTTWIMVGATGRIITDVGVIVVSDTQKNEPDHYSHLPENHKLEFEKSIAKYGFTLDQLRHERDARLIHNARYLQERIGSIVYKPAPKKIALF